MKHEDIMNAVDLAVEYYYPAAMKMAKEKHNDKVVAERINKYAHRLQEIYYSAKHMKTENDDLLFQYACDIEHVWFDAKAVYEGRKVA